MQLFNVKKENDKLILGTEIAPIRFQDIPLERGNTKEKDIEDLIVKNPELLNCGEDIDDPELLIINRQLVSQTNKRADLVAIDTDGYQITIEVKRDATDEKNRTEAMEFQSIRYAATLRTWDVDAVIRNFANYLQSLNADSLKSMDYFLDQATQQICNHVADENGDSIRPETMAKYIDPTDKQKIYLVASDFAPDCLSACAWLREHKIDIYCFKLQPYLIAENYVLHQERLIPPTALDEFYIGTREAKEKDKECSGTRASSNKPTKIHWGEDEIVCKAWNQLLTECLKKSFLLGFSTDNLKIAHSFDENADVFRNKGAVNISIEGREQKLYFEKNLSSEAIRNTITEMLNTQNPRPIITVDLVDGTNISL